jgi:hypothetical protein
MIYKALHIVKVNLQNGSAEKYEKEKHKKFLKIWVTLPLKIGQH